MRHGERLDRYLESKGENWISTAERPQDSPLSPFGIDQACAVGSQLRDFNISHILSSPMIRTVQTSHQVASQISIEEILVEYGLVEEAKSFRGKDSHEPLPTWNPLILSNTELKIYSQKISNNYSMFHPVNHIYDSSIANTVMEEHSSLLDQNEITMDRCKAFIKKLLDYLSKEENMSKTILCVCHGAITNCCSKALQQDLPEHLHIMGSRSVCTYGVFVPYDKSNIANGPWFAPSARWEGGNDITIDNIQIVAKDNIDDRADK